MTERDLAVALKEAQALEREARLYWQAPGTPAAERQAALDVVRHATVVIRSLEKWIAARHVAAAT